MKKSEPTKKVMPIPGRVTDDHCDASAATRNQVEPTANRTAIHHSGVRSHQARGDARREVLVVVGVQVGRVHAGILPAAAWG